MQRSSVESSCCFVAASTMFGRECRAAMCCDLLVAQHILCEMQRRNGEGAVRPGSKAERGTKGERRRGGRDEKPFAMA